MSSTQEFDVIVVGSGAAGGIAAYQLTQSGARVLVLEAGRDYDPSTETPMFSTPQSAPLRASSTPDKPGGFFDATVDGGWQIPGEPYSVGPDSTPFKWWRSRMLGGRTNHWGRVALRYGPYDFKGRSRDGLGVDWPISYDDIAPWYDSIERLVGVTGSAHGIENSPDSPDGIYLPPPAPRVHEIFLSKAFERLGMRVAAIRAAILTKNHNGRPPCLFATPCTRGCSIGANFQSANILIRPAYATGNLTVRTNSVAYEVGVNDKGRATCVRYIDSKTGAHYCAYGKTIALAAGSYSSVRILLNSKSTIFADGIGNSEGLVGKAIMDSVEYTLQSRIPSLERIPPQNDDGIFTPHIYVPWWLYKEQLAGSLNFPRGYHIEPRGGRRMPSMDVGNYISSSSNAIGTSLHKEVRRKYGSYVYLTGEGEMVPNANTYCEIDPNQKDKWGIPTLRFHWEWSEHEKNQVSHMHRTFNEVFRTLGGDTDNNEPVMPAGGSASHEVGGARMGSSSSNSVVTQFGQCWDVRNLFVIDGSSFPSSADKNPTLTILALALRSASNIVRLSKRNEIP